MGKSDTAKNNIEALEIKIIIANFMDLPADGNHGSGGQREADPDRRDGGRRGHDGVDSRRWNGDHVSRRIRLAE